MNNTSTASSRVSWAPKSARIAALLLIDRRKTWGVIELAEAAGIAPSYVVKILRNLVRAGWVVSAERGYRLEDARALLHSWATAPLIDRTTTGRRYVVPGDVVEVERAFVETANRLRARYALTLFSGARRRAPFVRYSVAHAYLEANPSRIATEIGARSISEGGNLVLIRPEEEGIFLGVQECEGARIVSNPRLYVDLYNMEARGREQAEYLLETVMPDLRTEETPGVRAAFHEALAMRDSADKAILESRWSEARELLEKARSAFASSPSPSAAREEQRARLLLWMALAHVAFERRDRKAIEKAREICVTESDVESLRREVGYNAAHAGLALLAFFATQAILTKDRFEKRTYMEKARNHFTIITSPYAESHQEVEQPAKRIWESVSADREAR